MQPTVASSEPLSSVTIGAVQSVNGSAGDQRVPAAYAALTSSGTLNDAASTEISIE